jgi:hypothetical protein
VLATLEGQVAARGLKLRALLFKAVIWRNFAIRKHLLVSDAKGSQVGHVVMTVDFLEATVLVAEVAPLAVGAVLFSVELATVLRLVLVVEALLLFVKVERVILGKLFEAVRVLTLIAITTEAGLSPVLAHLSLVHGALDE